MIPEGAFAACLGGQKQFVCCKPSPFPPPPLLKESGGCAFSKVDAWAQCSQYNNETMYWNRTSCLGSYVPPSPAQKVENAFMDILGHKSGNTPHWVEHMNNVGYTQMRQDISHSREGQELVEATFREILNHPSGNINFWATHLGNVGYHKMRRDIRCSSEGISIHGSCE